MIGTIANLVAYSRAPKKTYFVKHPIKALAARKAADSLKSGAKKVGIGVGAAAVAVPLGLWIGKKVR